MKRNYFLIGVVLIAAVLAATLIAYPHLPLRVPTHWNARGEIDGYSARWTLLVMIPGIMSLMLGLFALLPWLSPKHFEVDSFRLTYLYLMLVTVAFLAYVHALILMAGLGHARHTGEAIGGGVCVLFMLLGQVLGKVRRNFWIGVRTPWTLANERVWDATHRFAAKTFVIGGAGGLLLTLVRAPFWASFGVLMAGALVPVVHSLVYYKRLQRLGEI
ncbi:MAG: SdpI family protein [Terriglobia bacterium]